MASRIRLRDLDPAVFLHEVGIGVEAPLYKLHIKTADGAYGLIHENASGVKLGLYTGGSSASIGTATNHKLELLVNGDPKVTIGTGGDVGIGTGSTGPNSKLDVRGDSIRISNGGSGNSNDTSSRILFNEGIGGAYGDDGGKYGFSLLFAGAANPTLDGTAFTLPANTFHIINHDNSLAGNAALSIDRATGKVGIGTGASAPAAKLEIYDSTINSLDLLHLRTEADSVNDYVGLKFAGSTDSNGAIAALSAIRSYAGPYAGDSYIALLTSTDTDGSNVLVQGLVQDHRGYIGIGTGASAPSSLLHIKQSSGSDSVMLDVESNNDGGIRFGRSGHGSLIVHRTTSKDYMAFHVEGAAQPTVGGTPKMVINEDGLVGIGTGSTAPAKLLELSADTNGTVELLRLTNADSTYMQQVDFSLDTNKDLVLTGGSSNGGIVFSMGARGYKFNNGPVGIGTGSSAPTQKLSVEGNGYFSTASGGELTIANSGASGVTLQQTNGGATNSGTLKLRGGTSVSFTTNDVDDRLTIDSSGNCGIGTGASAPSALLHCAGTSQFDGTIYLKPASGSSKMYLYQGSSSKTPYIAWHRPDGNRVGYLGYSTADMELNLENDADFIVNGGNFSIGTGTSVSGNKLTVQLDDANTSITNGSCQLELVNVNATNGNYSRIFFNDAVGGNASALIGGKIVNHTNNYGDLEFWTRGATGYGTRLTIDSDGDAIFSKKVGIGTGSDTLSKLLTLKSTESVIRMTSSSGKSYDIASGGGDGTIAGDLAIINQSDGGTPFRIKGGSNSDGALTIDAGNVGIGTGSVAPAEKLDVRGNISWAGTHSSEVGRLISTDTDSVGIVAVDEMAFYVANANVRAMHIAADGKVGIGTSLPQAALDLGNASSNKGIAWGGTSGTAHYASIWTEYGSSDLVLGTWVKPVGTSTGMFASYSTSSQGMAAIKLDSSTGDILFYGESPQTLVKDTTVLDTIRMSVGGDGKVGIGTGSTAPTKKLEINAGDILLSNIGLNKYGLLFGEGANQTMGLRYDGTGSNGNLEIVDGSNNLLVNFEYDGNVGIGTGLTAPTYKLHVKDNNSAVAMGEYAAGAVIWMDGANGDLAGGDYFGIHASDDAFQISAAGTTRFTLKDDGKVGIGTTSFGTSTGKFFVGAQPYDGSGAIAQFGGFIRVKQGIYISDNTTPANYVGWDIIGNSLVTHAGGAGTHKVGIGTGSSTPGATRLDVWSNNTHVSDTPTARIYHYNNPIPDPATTNVPALAIQVSNLDSDLHHHGYTVLEQLFTGSAAGSPFLYFKTNKNSSDDKEWWGLQAMADSKFRLTYKTAATPAGDSPSIFSVTKAGVVGDCAVPWSLLTDVPSLNDYTHPTDQAGDDIDVDTGPLTLTDVISDIDINITTNIEGHVTDANGSIATRTLTLGDFDSGLSMRFGLPTITGGDSTAGSGILTMPAAHGLADSTAVKLSGLHASETVYNNATVYYVKNTATPGATMTLYSDRLLVSAVGNFSHTDPSISVLVGHSLQATKFSTNSGGPNSSILEDGILWLGDNGSSSDFGGGTYPSDDWGGIEYTADTLTLGGRNMKFWSSYDSAQKPAITILKEVDGSDVPTGPGTVIIGGDTLSSTAPSATALEVNGNINLVGGAIYYAGTQLVQGSTSSTSLWAEVGSDNRIYYTAGSVGIGSSDPSTAFSLEVGGAIGIDGQGEIFSAAAILSDNVRFKGDVWFDSSDDKNRLKFVDDGRTIIKGHSVTITGGASTASSATLTMDAPHGLSNGTAVELNGLHASESTYSVSTTYYVKNAATPDATMTLYSHPGLNAQYAVGNFSHTDASISVQVNTIFEILDDEGKPRLTLSGDGGLGAVSLDYTDITSVPSSFTPEAHEHAGSDITSGTVPAGYLPAATLTAQGAVELATTTEATTGTDTARAVTPAGVKAVIDALVDGAPDALNTLNELAASIGDDASYASGITTSLGGKVSLSGADQTINGGVNTTLRLVSTDAGKAHLIVGDSTDGSQSTGAIEVTQDGNYGGGISYNGNGSPVFVTGETEDHVTFYRVNSGTRSEVFHYAYNSDTVNFNGNITLGASKTVDGRDLTVDGSKLDGIAASATNTAVPTYTSAIPTITATIGGLMSNTNAVKFAGIATGATNTAVPTYTSAIPTITATVGGLMSDTNAVKFAGIATGATNTSAPHYTSAIGTGDGKLTTKDFTTTLKNKLDGIASGATNTSAPHYTSAIGTGDGKLTTKDFTTTLKNKLDGIASGATNTSAPHYTSAIGTGDGKLTTKNFTTTLKNKLDGIASGATNTSAPHYTSAIGTGDGKLTTKNFTTTLKNKLDGIASGATNTSAPHYTSAIGTGDGKLTTKDFTTTLKNKLDGIASGATNTSANTDVNWNGTSGQSASTAGGVSKIIKTTAAGRLSMATGGADETWNVAGLTLDINGAVRILSHTYPVDNAMRMNYVDGNGRSRTKCLQLNDTAFHSKYMTTDEENWLALTGTPYGTESFTHLLTAGGITVNTLSMQATGSYQNMRHPWMHKGGSFQLYQYGPSTVSDQIQSGMCSPYGVFGTINDENHSFDSDIPGGSGGHGWLKQWARGAGLITDADGSSPPDGTPCVQSGSISKGNWKFGIICLRDLGVEGTSYLAGNVLTQQSVLIDPLNESPDTAGLVIGGGLHTDGTLPHYEQGGVTYVPRLSVNGSMYNLYSGVFSDRRLKKDIVHLDNEDCLDIIKKLRGVSFKWKEDAYFERKDTSLNALFGVDHYGFIAQEVEEILPEIVSTRVGETGEKDGLKVINNDALIPLLVEALKAQQEQIEALREEVENLKNS